MNHFKHSEELYCDVVYGVRRVFCEMNAGTFRTLAYMSDGIVALAIAGTLVAIWLWRQNLKRLRYGALQILRKDHRAPVLLLRSFADDQI